MTKPHLILGGARSGKSRFAEKLALAAHNQAVHSKPRSEPKPKPKPKLKPSQLIYLATATAGDEEMASRIDHHQARRNEQWQTIEASTDLATTVNNVEPNSVILIDCLTLWLSNCLHQACWSAQKSAFLYALENSEATIIMVSNEVGSGIVPMGELSRQFVDESGWLHQQLAKICGKVTLVVAGLPMTLK